MPDLSLEAEMPGHLIAGCDEAGRGPFAGPLIAVAVILKPDPKLSGVNDSKKVRKAMHRTYAEKILTQAVAVGVGVAGVEYINQYGIGKANRYALTEAIKNLRVAPTGILTDGTNEQRIDTTIPQKQIMKGDQKSLSIASASILAKSIHDEIMNRLAVEYPEYNWTVNAGYGTSDHIQAIETYGVCKYHRTSFKPIKVYIQRGGRIRT